MGKKKFIDKKNSQKFHLLHRSQMDMAHAQEGVPSEFVLVPVTEKGDVIFGQNKDGAPEVWKKGDHINEFGLPNDGYDYSKHLKQMGGGKFISKDGSVVDSDAFLRGGVTLPSDVLPSEEELKRDYEAITITHELMDEDLRAALFDGFDEEGNFEELDDNFVDQVMKEPEVPDFDFDAHIANLIAKSERMLGISKARGWDDEDAKRLVRKVDYPDEFSEGDEVESWQEEEDYDREDYKSLPNKQADFTDEQLEELLQEYEDGKLGEMEDLEDEEFQGEIDVNDTEDPMLKQALDSFLQDQIDRKYARGINSKKGDRSTINLAKKQDEEVDPASLDIKKEKLEQELLQKEWEEQIKEIDKNEKNDKVEDVINSVAYLKETKVYEEWDCETIISTYSTLDNHPTLVKDPKTKFRPFSSLKKSRHSPQHPSQLLAQANSDTASLGQSSQGSQASKNVNYQPASSTGKIVLSGKLNLPEGFSRYSQGKNNKKEKKALSNIKEEDDDDEDEDESEESEEEEEDKDENNKQFSDEKEKKPQKESKEEKRQRKNAVKEERRQKRMNKKLLKTAFQKEGMKIIKTLGTEQSTDHVSVFKYSN